MMDGFVSIEFSSIPSTSNRKFVMTKKKNKVLVTATSTNYTNVFTARLGLTLLFW